MSHQSLLPEPLTIELTMLLVMLLSSSNYVVIWFQNRRQVGLLWMLGGSLLSSLAFGLRLALPAHAGIVITPVSILVGLSCTWMGCRTAAGLKPWLPSLLVPAGLWLLICCIPGVLHVPSARFAVTFLLVAALLALALRELWPPEARGAMSTQAGVARWLVMALLAVAALFSFAWGIAQAVSLVDDLGLGSDAVGMPVAAFALLGFSLIMNFAFVALVKEQSDRELSQTAQRDALTGLGNRRHLDDSLETAVGASRGTGAPLAVVMIDVDRFKAYNDHYGHPAGDACLRAVAGALRGGLIRREDAVSRYGGEEFIVILADTQETEAMAIANRLRLAVRALKLPHAGHAGHAEGIVTISLGVAVMAGGTILDGASLVSAADHALYRAKEAGRDRVESFGETVAASPPALTAAPTSRLDPA